MMAETGQFEIIKILAAALVTFSMHSRLIFRIGPDRAYPLHFTRPQLLLPVLLLLPFLSLLCISGMKLGWNLFLLVFLGPIL